MTLPKAEAEPERYRGRPLLIILENYILAALGELSPEQHEGLRAIVQHVFGGGDDWMATVRQRLELGPSIDDSLRAMWTKNVEIARRDGVQIVPVQFAKMVTDTNFAALIGPPTE